LGISPKGGSISSELSNGALIPIGIHQALFLTEYQYNRNYIIRITGNDNENMPPEIQLAGIHPRSERLIELTRSYERAKTSWSQVEIQIEQETKELIKLQRSLGFGHVSDGALGWQDQLRPITRSLKGVESGTRYSRWFDTNTFYQKPIVVSKISAGEIDPKNFLQTKLLAGEKNRKITLPGPYTFSQLSENKYYEKYPDLLFDVAVAEREIIKKLRNEGVSLFQLSEPCLVYQPYRETFRDDSEVELGLRAIRSVVENNPREFVIQTYFGDACPLFSKLLDLPVRGIGIDLFETDVSSLSEQTSKTLVLGAVDSRESYVEDPQWIADTARKLSEQVPVQNLVFASNSDLKFVPQRIANQKLEALSKASELFEESR
jgi:5-methyltetrahydropteroyltriglutamate--homocysteine methyltransferase